MLILNRRPLSSPAADVLRQPAPEASPFKGATNHFLTDGVSGCPLVHIERQTTRERGPMVRAMIARRFGGDWSGYGFRQQVDGSWWTRYLTLEDMAGVVRRLGHECEAIAIGAGNEHWLRQHGVPFVDPCGELVAEQRERRERYHEALRAMVGGVVRHVFEENR